MSNSPDSKLPLPEPGPDGQTAESRALGLPGSAQSQPAGLPIANPSLAAKSLPSKSSNPKRSRRKLWIGGTALLASGIAVVAFMVNRPEGARADVILHKVKKEVLNVNVTEKGTLESADNKDMICKVRAGTKGFATTVNWVVDDGTRVNPGDLLMILDDSALKDQQEQQEITVTQRLGDKINAEKDHEIQLKNNEIDVATAETNLLNAEVALEKLLGFEVDGNLLPFAAVAGVPVCVRENGSYRQSLDDLSGKITQAMSDVEQNRERAAWSERMVKQAYMSPAQAEADKSRLESSVETLRSLRAQKAILINYDRRVQIADLTSKRDNARLGLDQARLKAEALAVQKATLMKTTQAVYTKELDKLLDLKQQRSECRITAPLGIRPGSMVVYFKPEGNRFGAQSQNLIEQGAQVKEGQKMLRIPNLEAMQVNTKIHEAMVSRVRGDNRVPTRIVEFFQIGLYTNLNPFARGYTGTQSFVDLITSSRAKDNESDEVIDVHQLEFHVKEPGQKAIVRIDAMPDKRYAAHVKSVSQVASQTDVWISDVKLYPTLVIVDNEIAPDGQMLPVSGEILKPDMTAEVTISVDASKEPVPTVPLQAVIGGAEMGASREVFVKAANGYARRAVVLGLFNDKMIEVREGLSEGDEVVTNPKVLLGDSKTKTRDGSEQKQGRGKDGKAPQDGDPTKKKKGPGGPPGGPGGGPGGPKT
jgi:multidrug efflux pump subunit AcrA (membrane-fusion protein)